MTCRRRFAGAAGAALFALVAAAGVYLAARHDGYAADKSDPPKPGTGPVDYIPADAAAFVSLRVADLVNYSPVKVALEKERGNLPEPLPRLKKMLGVELDQFDQFVMIEGSNRADGHTPDMWGLVTTLRPYDKKAVLGSLSGDPAEKSIGDHSYYEAVGGPAVAFLDDRTYLMSDVGGMEAYFRRAGVQNGPLAPALRTAAEKHVLVVGVNVPAYAANLPEGDAPPPWAKPLLEARVATLTVDLDEQLRADLRATFAGEADAREGLGAVTDALDMVRAEMVKTIGGLKQLADAPKTTALLRDVQTALRAAKAEQRGATVEVKAAMKVDPDATSAALIEAIERVKGPARRAGMAHDLKMLGLAAQNYHDTIGYLPQEAAFDKNGKPLLSWRVALLPYVEQSNLYNEFHLDEPWDSEHNKKLLDRMPAVFAPPESEAFRKHEAIYQGLVGKGTVFEGKDTKLTAAAIDKLNGTANTILFVEAAKSVPWTKPEDIPLDEEKLVPRLGGMTKDGFLAVFCDGHVQFVSNSVNEKDLRRAATYTNTEPFTLPDK